MREYCRDFDLEILFFFFCYSVENHVPVSFICNTGIFHGFLDNLRSQGSDTAYFAFCKSIAIIFWSAYFSDNRDVFSSRHWTNRDFNLKAPFSWSTALSRMSIAEPSHCVKAGLVTDFWRTSSLIHVHQQETLWDWPSS